MTTKIIFSGSSKNFYEFKDGRYLMAFKDDIHGNNRAAMIKGTGLCRKEFTYYFFKYLESKGVATHLDESSGISALRADGLVVKQCSPIKLEILVRKVARGHWVDAHKIPLFEGGTVFDEPIVEFCLKLKKTLEDGREIDDPRINSSLAVALHKYAKDPSIRGHMLLDLHEAEHIESLAKSVYSHYQEFLHKNKWTLEDFKFEIGVLKNPPSQRSRKFVVIDEISPDCSRIRDADGNSLTKDLFRQRRPEEEILQHYSLLSQAIKQEVESR